jgi:VWFA-related protein
MASGARTIRHLLGLAGVLCLASAVSHGVVAQGARPDPVAIIQTFSDTGRTDYRFQSRDEALAFIKAWPAGVDRWIAAGNPAESERRRNIAALTALEFVPTAFDGLDGAASRGLFEALVEAAHAGLWRPSRGDFERRWLRALTTVLLVEHGGVLSAPLPLLVAAAERFPRDPRLRLNHVLADRDTMTLANTPGTSHSDLADSLGHGDRDPATLSGRSPVTGRAEDVFLALLTDPEVGAEAAARLGWLRFHQNKLAESRVLFETAIATTSDPFVSNLAGLGLGLTHRADGRNDDATAAFRAAVASMPTARTATTALAMQLFLAGQRQDAADLLDQLAGVPNTFDPWKHVSGAGRLVDGLLRDLRAELGVPPRLTPSAAPVSVLAPASTPSPAATQSTAPATADPSTPPPDIRQASPQFRATTSIVSVDAAVLNGRRPVEGLTAADFEVRDNGVTQTIDSVSLDGLPLDVTVVLDLRDIAFAVHTAGRSTVVQDATSQGVADTAQLSALLRPEDRLRIVTATRDVAEPHPLQGPGGRALHRVPREQMSASALYDAVFTALARRTPAERRHLVLVFTDGFDGASITTSKQLLQAAAASDALVQVFRRDTAGEFFRRSGRRDESAELAARFLLRPHDSQALPALAEATSGSLERVTSTGQSVVADVQRTLDSFRQRYILRYRPTGVDSGGWHGLSVRVTKPGRFTVQSRRGYDGG